MPRQPNTDTSTFSPALSEEQQREIDLLQAQIDTYTKSLNQAIQKRNKIKLILDNFEDVVLGNLIQNILPDLNDPDILNQPIINSVEIRLTANNPNSPYYPYRQFIQIVTDYIIQSDEAVAIIAASNGELNSIELPYPIWIALGNELYGNLEPFNVGFPYFKLLLAHLVNS